MRLAIAVAVVATPAVSHAGSFFEILGGLSIPTSDSNWTQLADPSPKLRASGGTVGESGLGGMVRLDWTPVSLDNSGGSLGAFGNADIAGHRFRVLADITYDRRVASKLVVSARTGAGIDIAHASAHFTVLGSTTTSADTDVGFAFELAGGLWLDLGGAQIGGEVALPIGHHAKQGNATDGNYTFDYTSYDIDIMVGVRFHSQRSSSARQ